MSLSVRLLTVANSVLSGATRRNSHREHGLSPCFLELNGKLLEAEKNFNLGCIRAYGCDLAAS